MPRAQKFGAFSGVFTPSILTILGVIMYLRLPSIVGQAGLVQTLLIILVAHTISVATGLSVSSIATDKKVRAGGTYFMISRSLGLPIGGTLGLALFVGLSFSVSLYLIGFSESFLSYWGLPADKNAIRIAGSIALIAVTIVTLISTALALKTQFYIMAAIALSLLSILLGRHELGPAAEPLAETAVTAAPFILLFGIFFPAVTGFEAGVSMSGDLADPKRAIPKGTIAAIAVGLVVYVGLAAFLALTVDATQLATNPRILLDIALFPPLVVAGIWGATISSAFGSILGAPRILQATSADGITPRWFARGYGPENEPRHALVLAFVIAEAGILIGELNAIARIVSMFFITTYGFLNLTAAIEARVSPDFRPEFRVPAWVGLIGGAACFIVMIQLDFVAMLGATILLGGLYLYLKRKQLRLETGDTWEGVWSAMARGALSRLVRAQTHRRNWRPNLLLFGGEASRRAHLVEFALQLCGERGVVTNVEVTDRPAPARTRGNGAGTVFTRRVHGDDVYQAIEEVARHYGFAGMEPNTVLLGWTRSTDAPRFTHTLQSLVEQDLNVLLLDYDRDRGWGKRERIDVWWRLTGKDVAFSLALVRFLTTSDEWRDARVRFLTVNDGDSALTLPVSRDLARVLAEHRVEADIVVLNNAVQHRAFLDIVRTESADADLTVLGMADVRSDDAARFIADTNALVDVLGTAVLAHASSLFQEPLIESAGLDTPQARAEAAPAELPDLQTLPALVLPQADPLPALMANLDTAVQVMAARVMTDYLGRAYALNRDAIAEIGELARSAAGGAGSSDDDSGRSAGERFLGEALERVTALRRRTDAQRALLAGAIDALTADVAAVTATVPARVTVIPPAAAWERRPGEPVRARLARARARIGALRRRRPARYHASLRELVRARLDAFASVALRDSMTAFAADAHRTTTAMRRLVSSALERVDAAEWQHAGAAPDTQRIHADVAHAIEACDAAALRARADLLRSARATVNAIAEDAARIDAGGARAAARRAAAVAAPERPDAEAPRTWAEAHGLATGEAELALRLNGLADGVTRVAADARAALESIIENGLVEPLESMRHALAVAAERPLAARIPRLAELTRLDPLFHPEAIAEQVRAAFAAAAAGVPESVTVPADESAAELAAGHFDNVIAATFPARQVVDYVAEGELLGPLLEDLLRAAPRIEEAAEVGREVAQLASYHLGSLEGPRDDTSEEQVAALLRAGVERTSRAIEVLRQVLEQLRLGLDRRFAALGGRLDGTAIHRLAERMPEYLRSRRSARVLGRFRHATQRAAGWASDQVVGVVYRRSEGVVLAGHLRRGADGGADATEPLRRFVAAVSPRPAMLERLPHYYRQLFLGRPVVTDQLRVGFQRELEETADALAARAAGAAGALVLLGEPGQGRRTLSNIIAEEHAGAGAVIRVDAPEGGSIDPAAFLARLGQALGREHATPARLATLLPAGSALVINNLERWWERSLDGGAVLDVIDELIARAPRDCLIIANAGPRSFRLLNQLRPLDDRILRVVECTPFNARQLRQVILPRHASTGLTLEWNGRREERLSELQLARLFDAHFAFSAGNVGSALHAWIANIERVDGELLRIRAPRRPALDAFDTLDPVQLMLLVQQLLHGRLTRARMARVAGLDPGTLGRALRALVRAGVLRESPAGAIAVDRFVRPHLVRFLAERELA